jgi:uncharacterized protein YlxW (UPF0749 family)
MSKESFFHEENSSSMGLLNLLNNEIETNEYLINKDFRIIKKDPKWLIFLVLSFAGLFLGIAIANFQQKQPGIEKSRSDLRIAIENRLASLNDLSQDISLINDEINLINIETSELDFHGLSQNREKDLITSSSVNSLSGPGLVILLNDAPKTDALNVEDLDLARIFDSDMQIIVNALWASGAEAISVNNQRLSSTTAIRSAGDAILVNYRPLLPPYEIAVIGNGDMIRRLEKQKEFLDLSFVAKTYGLILTITPKDIVEIPAMGVSLPDITGITVGNRS